FATTAAKRPKRFWSFREVGITLPRCGDVVRLIRVVRPTQSRQSAGVVRVIRGLWPLDRFGQRRGDGDASLVAASTNLIVCCASRPRCKGESRNTPSRRGSHIFETEHSTV